MAFENVYFILADYIFEQQRFHLRTYKIKSSKYDILRQVYIQNFMQDNNVCEEKSCVTY